MKSKKEQKKININGKPKYINLGTDYNFFELFQKIIMLNYFINKEYFFLKDDFKILNIVYLKL